jgi:hypothetical protein
MRGILNSEGLVGDPSFANLPGNLFLASMGELKNALVSCIKGKVKG